VGRPTTSLFSRLHLLTSQRALYRPNRPMHIFLASTKYVTYNHYALKGKVLTVFTRHTMAEKEGKTGRKRKWREKRKLEKYGMLIKTYYNFF